MSGAADRGKIRLFAAIRRDSRREQLSVRALAKRYGVHRRTVREALVSAVPKARKPRVAQAPKLEPVKPLIDAMLVADLDAPRKQRHSAARIHARLVQEHGVDGLSYSTVRDYVRGRRPWIREEAGRGPAEGFIPQEHLPGQEAEADFGEVWVDLAGKRTRCYMFALRMSFSGKAFHKIFLTCTLEAFIEGHQYALSRMGGVPARHIRYDNLKPAVSKVLGAGGRQRLETDRWIIYRSHMGIDPFWCQPGREGAHEKGGVEGEVGRFRRNHLVPVPAVSSLDELNDRIALIDEAEDVRHVDGRPTAVGDDFAVEQPLLRPLPLEPFEAGNWTHAKVDRYARITVRSHRYSVPARLIGREIRVLVYANEIAAFDGAAEVARHRRSTEKNRQTLVLDHYLELLMRKPGALPGATALSQARAAGVFTAAHEAFWQACRRLHGDAAGTRALIDVLLLHRRMPHDDVVAGLEAAVSVGACTADVVAVEARKAGQHRPAGRPVKLAPAPVAPLVTAPILDLPLATVTSLTERRLITNPAAVIGGLPPDLRPLPTVTHYDQLLRMRKPALTAEEPDNRKGQAS